MTASACATAPADDATAVDDTPTVDTTDTAADDVPTADATDDDVTSTTPTDTIKL